MSSADVPLRGRVQSIEDSTNSAIATIFIRLNLLEAVFNVRMAIDIPLSAFTAPGSNYSMYSAVQLRADVGGQPGYFVKVATGPTHDGVRWIVDSVGTTFERRSLT